MSEEEAAAEVPPAEEAVAAEAAAEGEGGAGEVSGGAEGEAGGEAAAEVGGEAAAGGEGEGEGGGEGGGGGGGEGAAAAAEEGSPDAPAAEEAEAEAEPELEAEASEEVELDEDGNPIVKEDAPKAVVKEDKDMLPFMCNVYIPARKMTFSVTVYNKCEIEDIQRQIAAKLTRCDETEYLLNQIKLTYRDAWDADAAEPKEIPLEDKKTVKDYYITAESMPRATVVAAE